MRQATGGVWVIQLMLLFIMLFVGYVVITIEYSRTLKMKNEVISMVEKYEGINTQSIELIGNFLSTSRYGAQATCTDTEKEGIYGATSLDGSPNSLEKAEANKKYYYCIKKFKGRNQTFYYQVLLFYKFNLPVLGDVSYFNVRGTTTNFQPHDLDDYINPVTD